MNNNTNINILEAMKKPVFTPLKEGKYTCQIEKVGINENPQALELPAGYYQKKQVEGKNNNYFRLDLLTSEGKRTNRNVFPEQISMVIPNIKRQLGIEEALSTFDVLSYCLTEKSTLDMWIWYNESNKNVDFYDAITVRDSKNAANENLFAAIDQIEEA